jgi:hypothetical protein
MTTAVKGLPIQTIASGKQPQSGVSNTITTIMPNVPSARPVYTSTVVPAPAFSQLHGDPGVGYPA